MTVDPTRLSDVLTAIEKKYGGDAAMWGNRFPEVATLTTGSLELDWAMGGGVPWGRFTRFWGGYSSAKSLVAMNVAREAQKQGYDVTLYNVEKQYDPIYWKSRGVDVDNLLVIQASAIEEIGSALEGLLGARHVHIIDSTTAAMPLAVMEKQMEEETMGQAPRAWGKVLGKCEARLGHDNMVIMISQARAAFGYGGGEEAPGGMAMEHVSSMTVQFRRASWLFYDSNGNLSEEGQSGKTLSGRTEADGASYVARVQKSRVSRPLRQAEMWYDFAEREFDLHHDYLKAAKHFGIVEVKGGWYKLRGSDAGIRAKEFFERIDDPASGLAEEIENALYGRLAEEKLGATAS